MDFNGDGLLIVKKSPQKKTARVLRSKSRKKLPASAKAAPEPKDILDIFAPPTDYRFAGIYIPKSWYKSVAVFVLISLSLVLPLQAFSYYQKLQTTKDKILFLTNQAIDDLKTAQVSASGFDLATANSEFGQAKENFYLAQKQVSQINFLTTELIKLLPGEDKNVNSGLSLLSAGESLAEAGQILTNTGAKLSSGQGGDYYQLLLQLRSDLEQGINKFSAAQNIINKISISSLPKNQRQTFSQVKEKLPLVAAGLTDIYTLNSTLLKILGEKQWQRYLVVFANNNEMRGSGGFMGSFALLDIDRGQIKKLEIPGGGTYDIQGQLVPLVMSPEPLRLINARWEFQDSNWWPDFPTSAKKMQWFYQNAGGPSTDGVILMTATLMERLLEVLGPVEMAEYGGRTISSDNFVAETQKIVELEYDKEKNKPKQFIADLSPKILEKVFSAKGDSLKKILEILHQGLNEKQLLLYFSDPKTENIVASLNWAGQTKETAGDFLMVVNSNIGGAKTDAVIDQEIYHQSEIMPDGTIVNTVKLKRTHNGVKGEDIFTGVQNNDYVRFYVPAGSTLISASGFSKPDEKYFEKSSVDLTPDIDLLKNETERTVDRASGTDIYKESGKTVFGNWLQLNPGKTQEAVIKYQLPFKIIGSEKNTFYYSLLAEKQSGSRNTKLLSNVIFNDNLKVLTKYPSNLTTNTSTVEYNADFSADQFYGVVFTNQ